MLKQKVQIIIIQFVSQLIVVFVLGMIYLNFFSQLQQVNLEYFVFYLRLLWDVTLANVIFCLSILWVVNAWRLLRAKYWLEKSLVGVDEICSTCEWKMVLKYLNSSREEYEQRYNDLWNLDLVTCPYFLTSGTTQKGITHNSDSSF